MYHNMIKGVLLSMIMMLPSLAIAQESDDNDKTTPPHSQTSKNKTDTITVTGSRIRRENLPSLAPISVINQEDITLSGETELGEIVKEHPILLGSSSIENDDTGIGSINLRALGSKRSLVLVDGRRHVSANAGTQSVDINTIPSALIEHIDIVTGGTSAIYGADAVTGVVNIILKKDFEGLDLRTYLGSSTYGDGFNGNFSLTAGGNFGPDNRGNATFSADYSRKTKLLVGDRDFLKNNGRYDKNPNPALRFQKADMTPELLKAGIRVGDRILSQSQNLVPNTLWQRAENAKKNIYLSDSRYSISSLNGLIAFDVNGDGDGEVCGDNTLYLDTNQNGKNDLCETYLGRVTGYGTHVYGQNNKLMIVKEGLISSFTKQFGGDGIPNRLNTQSALPDYQRYTFNSTLNYRLMDNINFFANAKYSKSETKTYYGVNSFHDFIPISLDNPYLPAELKTALNQFLEKNPGYDGSKAQFLVSRDQSDLGNMNRVNTNLSTFRTVFGIEGKFPNEWNYELSYNYGKTQAKYSSYDQVDDRWFAAIDAVKDPKTGEIVCRSDLDSKRLAPTASYPYVKPGFRTFQPGNGQCHPANIFGRGNISKEAIDFFAINNITIWDIEQQVLNGYITGDTKEWFSVLPYPISFAVGAEYRKETSDYQTSHFEKSSLFFSSGTQPVSGQFDTSEAFFEVLLPIIKDRFLFEDIELGAAIRFADYSTIGKTTSWQAGLNWQIIPDFKLKATYSNAIRAPNISELFSPLQPSFSEPDDPCDANFINLGNNPKNRLKNCRSAGIPEDWIDPNSARIQGEKGGNSNLQEENAKTYTLGFSLTPGNYISDLSLHVDYWNIKIEDAIESPDTQDIINACYDAESTDNVFCKSIMRNPKTLGLNYFKASDLNFASVEAEGIDFSGYYRFDLNRVKLGRFGHVDLGVLGTYLIDITEYRVPADPTAADPETEEFARPKWSVNYNMDWIPNDKWVVRNQIRYQSHQYFSEQEDADQIENVLSRQFWVYDLSFSYQWKDNISFYGGINNVMNEKPFKTSFTYPISSLGRYFFLGLHLKY